MHFWIFCGLYYGAIPFGAFFFCEILIEMLLLLHTDLETSLLVCLRSVTTGGSRGTQVKNYCLCATRDPTGGSRLFIEFSSSHVIGLLFVAIHYSFVQY